MQHSSITLFFILSTLLTASGCSDKSNAVATGTLEALKVSTIKQLVFVQGGTFVMGDVGYTDGNGQLRNFTGDANVYPLHDVTLTSYSIQSYETTFKDFDFYMTSIDEEIVGKNRRHRVNSGPNYPAKWLTWDQAQNYCQWLGNNIGYPMDLPTEAQWEYAARSRGKAVAHATNNGDIEYGVNYRDPRIIPHQMPVGSWPPNPLGIYDMTGNVSEWTVDLYYLYYDEPQTNPNHEIAPEGMEEYITSRIWRGSGVIGGKGQIQLYRRGKTHQTPPVQVSAFAVW
ncbi:MAG: formylglycine-generating enzyme family protein [Pseudomonadales bacterium]|nr:formylglycine-generating enzyme family protein [Pseudomonadales bacterium]